MDPLSIATACTGLINTIGPLAFKIKAFVRTVQDAGDDMNAMFCELDSLSLCLRTLRDTSTNINYPETLHLDLLAIVGHCDVVTKQMGRLLDELSSQSLRRRIQWSLAGKDQMEHLRSSLESHKSALTLALSMTTILMVSRAQYRALPMPPVSLASGTNRSETAEYSVQDLAREFNTLRAQALGFNSRDRGAGGTSDIRIEGISLRDLAREFHDLQVQIADLTQHDFPGGIILQRFLDDSTVYAESLADPGEHAFSDGTGPLEPRSQNHAGIHRGGHWVPMDPDFTAMQATNAARNRLSKVQRFELDYALQRLLRPKQTFFKTDNPGKRAREVRRLLDNGADLNLPQCPNLDALSLELTNKSQHVDVVTLLLERGADPNTHSKLMNAIAHGRGCEEPLLEYGSSPNLPQPYGQESNTYSGLAMSVWPRRNSSSADGLARSMLEQYGADPNAFGALTAAVEQNSFQHVALLIDRGADVRKRESGGKTALHALGRALDPYYFFSYERRNMERIVSLLMASGADVNAQDDAGHTSLYMACAQGNRTAVRILLDEGADVNVGSHCPSILRAPRLPINSSTLTCTQMGPKPGAVHSAAILKILGEPLWVPM